MKAVDVRAKSDDELRQQILDLRKEQFNLRFEKTGGQMKTTAGLREKRRDIARIKTILNERKVANDAPITPKKVEKKAAPKKAVAKKAPAKKKTASKAEKE